MVQVVEDGTAPQLALGAGKYVAADGLEERMPGVTHSSVGSLASSSLGEGHSAVLPAEAAKAVFLLVADRNQIPWDLADAVGVAVFAGRLGMQAGLGGGLHEELFDDLGHQPPFLGLGRPADDGREVEFLAGQALQRRFGDGPESLGADVADDAVLNLPFVGLPGVHLPQQLLQQVGREDLAHHVEDLIGAQVLADFGQPVEQLLQDAAFAGVLGHEVDDQAVVLLAVAVDAADPLLQADRVPGDVEVDHHPAELKVDAFAGRLGGHEHLGCLLELPLGADAGARHIAVADLHAAVDLRDRQPPLAELAQRALVPAIADEVVQGVLVLGEHQQLHLRDR